MYAVKKNNYFDLKERHQKEFSEFPMIFAFSNKQLKEGMEKLGLKENETYKLYRFGSTGGFYRKTDSPLLKELLKRHAREMQEAIAADTTGEGFIFEMFDYELANHEYCITYDVTDTLESLNLTSEEVKSNPALLHGLKKAIENNKKTAWE